LILQMRPSFVVPMSCINERPAGLWLAGRSSDG
jgi:hypothetical protein